MGYLSYILEPKEKGEGSKSDDTSIIGLSKYNVPAVNLND